MKLAPYYFGPKSNQIFPLAPHEVSASLDTLDTTITLHRHHFIEILFFISGQGTHIINGQPYPIQPGSFSLLMPYHVHAINSESEIPIVYYRCAFDIGLLLDKMDSEEKCNEIFQMLASFSPVVQCSEKERATIENIFRTMNRKTEDADFPFLLLRYEAFHLFLQYLRIQNNNESRHPTEAGIWHAVRYIYENASKSITLGSTAEQLNAGSKEELNHELISVLGVSFTGLVSEIRIRNACSLLLTFPELSVSNISKKVGFKSHTTFFRTFKEIWEITPDEFRHKYLFRSINTSIQNVPSAISKNIIYYIFVNYTKDLKTEWLAKRFNVNEQKLNQEFSLFLGMSFPDYLSLLRINKARSLLRATNIPTAIIAKELGFNSLRSFTRAFQKHVGMTPHAYRLKLDNSSQ